VDTVRQPVASTDTRHHHQQQQASDERDPNRQRQPLTASEARQAVSESHRTPSVQPPPSQAQRQTAPTAVTARPAGNELRNDHRTTSVSGNTALVASHRQQPMAFQPLLVATGQHQQPAGETIDERQVRGRVTHGQRHTAQAQEPQKLNPAADYWDEEPAEPMRPAPRSERHRQQQMLKRSVRQLMYICDRHV